MGDKVAFETPVYRGVSIRAYSDSDAAGDTRVEIVRDGVVCDHLTYPAYKIWNIAAHYQDIIDGEAEGNIRGWFIAGSDLLGGVVLPTRSQPPTGAKEEGR